MSDGGDDKIARRGGKLVLGLLVYAFTTFVIVGALGFWWGAKTFNDDGPLMQEKLITVERGMGLNQIAAKLESEGAIENRYLFVLGTRIMGAASALKAGEYQLEPKISAKEIAVKMRDHDVFGRRITVREGLTSFEVLQLLAHQENVTNSMIKTIPPEGYFLPETYDHSKGEATALILGRMEKAMFNTITELCQITPEQDSMHALMGEPCGDGDILKTVKDVLTLASIVEKETSVAKERAKVAGVFINRLKRGIALQTDPTVIYAITKGKHQNDGKGPLGRRLLRKDLQYDSPYNTYKYPGLPPGPIANPGRASIEAVLNPASHDYIFFVADGTGGHAFGKTLAEHNANVAKWRKIRREQAKKAQ